MFQTAKKFINIYSNIFSIISKKQRILLIYQIFLTIISIFFDIFSIALIIPLFGIYLSNQLIISDKYLFLSKYFDPESDVKFFLLLLFIVVLFIKSLFNSYYSWQQANLKYQIERNLSFRLFKNYMGMEFAFHHENNSDKLISHIVHDASCVGEVIFFSMQLMGDLLVLFLLLLLLGLIDWIGLSVFLTILSGAGLLYLYLSRRSILRLGALRSSLQSERINYLAQSLGAVKEIRVMGRENYFFDKVWTATSGTLMASRNNQFIQELPRVWLDIVAAIALISVGSILMTRGKGIAEVVSIFAVFSAAAFKVMPATNRILNCFHSIRYGFASLEILTKNKTYEKRTQETICLHNQSKKEIFKMLDMIKVSNISYRYSDSKENVLNKLSFEIKKGEFVGIVGQSGAGKSTLMNILLGLIPPSHGVVECDSVSIFDDLKGWQNQIGYVPQNVFISDDTLRRNIAFGVEDCEIKESEIWRAIEGAQLWDFVKNQSQGLDLVLGRMGNRISGGQKQRIGIARALYSDPAILIFDEPTTGLDEISEKVIIDTLSSLKGKKTIIMITHSKSNLKYCDKFINL